MDEIFDPKPVCPPQVKIAVYYESLCPDSKKFIKEQLAPVWRDFRGAIKVKLVPYGKSTVRLYFAAVKLFVKELVRGSTTTIPISAAKQRCSLHGLHETFQPYVWDSKAFARPLVLQMYILGSSDHLTSVRLSACSKYYVPMQNNEQKTPWSLF